MLGIFKIPIKVKFAAEIEDLNLLLTKIRIENPQIDTRLDKESREFYLSGDNIQLLYDYINKISEQIEIEPGKIEISFRERITHQSLTYTTRSANTLNSISIYLEPLDPTSENLILTGKISDLHESEYNKEILINQAHWSEYDSRDILDVYQGNILLIHPDYDPNLHRIQGSLVAGFRDLLSENILAKEPAQGIEVIIEDIKLHDDPRYTQYTQIAGMTFAAISLSMLDAELHLFEPILKFKIKIPRRTEDKMMSFLSKNRGILKNIIPDEKFIKILGEIPADKFNNILKEINLESMSGVKFKSEFLEFKKVPSSLEEDVILSIRKRKGMPLKLPHREGYTRFILDSPEELKALQTYTRILGIMKENNTDRLVFERLYLLEVLDKEYITMEYESDGLPDITFSFRYYLQTKGIKSELYGNMIIFTLLGEH